LLQGWTPDELHEAKWVRSKATESPRASRQALFGHPQACYSTTYEPLDLDSIHWLQAFLNDYDGVLIAVSHDRHFLNSI